MIKFIKPLSIYAASSLFSKGVSFLLLIVLTHYLSPGEQGIYTLFTVYVGVLFPIIHIGIINASQVEYFKMEKGNLRSYLVSSLSISVVIFVVISLLFFLLGNRAAERMNISPGWLVLIPVVAFSRIIPSLVSAIYRSMEEALKFTWYNVFMAIAYALFTLLFVLLFRMKWEGRILGTAAGGLLFFGIGLIILHKKNLLGNFGEVKKEHQLSALKFGLPLIPHLLAVILIDTSDKIFIANKMGVYEVGIYNMGYKFGALILLMQNIFMNVWNPFLYKRLGNEGLRSKTEIVKQAWFFFILIVAAVGLLTLISPFCFDHFIDQRYKEGIQFVFWVALGYCFYSIFNMLGSIILYFKKTDVLSYMSVANVLLNMALNYYLIDIYGTIGAAYATFISFFAIFICCFIYVNSIVRLPWFDPSIVFSKE